MHETRSLVPPCSAQAAGGGTHTSCATAPAEGSALVASMAMRLLASMALAGAFALLAPACDDEPDGPLQGAAGGTGVDTFELFDCGSERCNMGTEYCLHGDDPEADFPALGCRPLPSGCPTTNTATCREEQAKCDPQAFDCATLPARCNRFRMCDCLMAAECNAPSDGGQCNSHTNDYHLTCTKKMSPQ